MIKISLNMQILLGVLGGILLGLGFVMVGLDSPISQNGLYVASLISTLFIDLLKMILVPLVFTSIVVGVANLRAHHQINRVWQITLVFLGDMV